MSPTAPLSVLSGDSRDLPEVQILHRLFEEQMQQNATSTRPALYFKDKIVTFGELNCRANTLARIMLKKIKQHGLSCNIDGDHVVAVNMEPSDKLVVSLMAILKMGSAYLPLNPSFPQNRVMHVLNDSFPLFVLTSVDHKESIETQGLRESSFYVFEYETLIREADTDDLACNISCAESVSVENNPNQLSIVLYTTGSTGLPKGVRLTHKIVLNRLCWQWDKLPYQENEMCSFKTALTFVDSVNEIFGPLLKGLPVVIIPSKVTENIEAFVQTLDHHSITRLVLVPSLLRSILQYLSMKNNSSYLQKVRLWVCSGEMFPYDLLLQFFQHFQKGYRICNFYGSTEVMGDVTYEVFTSEEDIKVKVTGNKVPIGVPIDNTVVYLLDKNMRLVPAGTMGQIYVAGKSVAAGYVGKKKQDSFLMNPFDTRADFNTLYRTGDFGCLVNGRIVYEGRADSQVKVRGHRVDPSEVELALQEVDGVLKAVVLCYKPAEINQALVGFCTTDSPTLTADKVRIALKEALLPYMIPQIKQLDFIPLLVNGKTDRQTLLQTYEDEIKDYTVAQNIDYTGIPKDCSAAGKILLDTVAAVVGSSRTVPLSIHSNFFHVGGTSLNSVVMVTKLKDQGFEVGLTEFLAAKSLLEVLQHLKVIDEECTRKEEGKRTSMTSLTFPGEDEYISVKMQDKHKEDVVRIISATFTRKGNLARWANIKYEEYEYTLRKLWQTILETDLSFVVTDRDGNTVGVVVNFDASYEADVDVGNSTSFQYFLELIHHLEEKQKTKLPQDEGVVMFNFILTVEEKLTSQDSVALVGILEKRVLLFAAERGFRVVFTTNINDLTQQICEDLLGYQLMEEYQINQYVASDGTRPYAEAPDSLTFNTAFKYL